MKKILTLAFGLMFCATLGISIFSPEAALASPPPTKPPVAHNISRGHHVMPYPPKPPRPPRSHIAPRLNVFYSGYNPYYIYPGIGYGYSSYYPAPYYRYPIYPGRRGYSNAGFGAGIYVSL